MFTRSVIAPGRVFTRSIIAARRVFTRSVIAPGRVFTRSVIASGRVFARSVPRHLWRGEMRRCSRNLGIWERYFPTQEAEK